MKRIKELILKIEKCINVIYELKRIKVKELQVLSEICDYLGYDAHMARRNDMDLKFRQYAYELHAMLTKLDKYDGGNDYAVTDNFVNRNMF